MEGKQRMEPQEGMERVKEDNLQEQVVLVDMNDQKIGCM